MGKKFSRANIMRAVNFIAKNGTGDRVMERAGKLLSTARRQVAARYRLCEDIKALPSLDTIIAGRSTKLNTDIMYRVFLKDANRFAARQAGRIKFYQLVWELYLNYEECRAHIMCSTVEHPERLPAYKKDFADDSKWLVFPSAARTLSTAFTEDSAGKVLSDFKTFADSLPGRVTASTASSLPKSMRDRLSEELMKSGLTSIAVQAMVYTGKFIRMYPIVLMLTVYIDEFYTVRMANSNGYPIPIPGNWIPIMYRIPREPRKESVTTNTQGETK